MSSPPPSRSDTALLAAAREGDADAFGALMRRHWAGLHAYASRLVDPASADDLVQEFFLQLWARRDVVRVAGSVRGYLYGGVRHHALNARLLQRRHDARSAPIDDASSTLASPHDDPLGALEADELDRALMAAVGALPARCREIFVLCRESGLSYPEVAEALGVSLSTVKTQMGRAMAAIARVVHPYLVAAVVARGALGRF